MSIACYALHIRHPRAQILPSLTATCQLCTVSLKAGLSTYNSFARGTLDAPPIRRLPSRGNTSPFTQLLTFFRCVPLGTLHPRLVISDASVFSLLGVGFDAPHQPPIRLKAPGRLAPEPDVRPWHHPCPRKPSV